MSRTEGADGPEMSAVPSAVARDLMSFASQRRFTTILADPPWQFTNKTGKVAPEHKRISRYGTMKRDELLALPVADLAGPASHLYLWCPNAMLAERLAVLRGASPAKPPRLAQIRKDGGSDGRGVGFYFRNVTELILFGVRGKNARARAPGRRQVNLLATRKREHSRKPDEQYDIIEACKPRPWRMRIIDPCGRPVRIVRATMCWLPNEEGTGAGDVTGIEAVARSAPDGYTIGIGAAGALAVNLSSRALDAKQVHPC
jgi:N6-adenosine-specific RNA methylase IME4